MQMDHDAFDREAWLAPIGYVGSRAPTLHGEGH
jgi:hypothetical protein